MVGAGHHAVGTRSADGFRDAFIVRCDDDGVGDVHF
jgi:hypothetical protein